MTRPDPGLALTRLAVRHALRRVFYPQDAASGGQPDGALAAASVGPLAHRSAPRCIVAGVSGGADSLALAAALAFEAPRLGVEAHAAIVDHGLQDGSAQVAERAGRICVENLGYPPERVRVVGVDVPRRSGKGPEAAARTARHDALHAVAQGLGGARVALAHTGDDQAEQVLLGLMRGSGVRALAGMRPERAGVLRPFLLGPEAVPGGPVLRAHTEAACTALGLRPWQDPHNDDTAFSRVRVRRVLGQMERELDTPTLRRSLYRTAQAAARDADLLDRLTDEALARAAGSDDASTWPPAWPVEVLTALDPALRVRALRRLLVLHGARDGELASHHVSDVERLLTAWRGQGPIDVPGHVEVRRIGGEVVIGPRRERQ